MGTETSGRPDVVWTLFPRKVLQPSKVPTKVSGVVGIIRGTLRHEQTVKDSKKDVGVQWIKV